MIDVFRDCLAVADLMFVVAVLWFYGRIAGWLLQGSFELVSRRADGLIAVLVSRYTQWQARHLCRTAKRGALWRH